MLIVCLRALSSSSTFPLQPACGECRYREGKWGCVWCLWEGEGEATVHVYWPLNYLSSCEKCYVTEQKKNQMTLLSTVKGSGSMDAFERDAAVL